jgi:hypothetical protein
MNEGSVKQTSLLFYGIRNYFKQLDHIVRLTFVIGGNIPDPQKIREDLFHGFQLEP